MVYFKDNLYPSGIQQLVILDDENQTMEKGTILAVHASLIGRYAKPWPKLMNSLHTKEWSKEIPLSKTSKVWALQSTHHQQTEEPSPLPTLGRSIIEGKAKWGDAIQFAGEFRYVKGYWEWTEDILSRCKDKLMVAQIYDPVYASLFTYDRNSEVIKAFCEAWCPSTNTLLTSLGELSISLWDLHTLAGLPMAGFFYDEVVPSAAELNGVDEAGSRYIPRSCKYLLHAYHLLRGSADGAQVSVDMWVEFWSKKAVKYQPPPPRREKKTVRPKSTHNPLGDFGVHKGWTLKEEALFVKLDIKGKFQEETYLAAHLACWLCMFVLPNDDINSIRPSTFKMASIMASGRMVGLAVPVLASIYKGLNKIAGSPRPSRVYSTFPIHFVYGWLAHYFKTHYQVWQGVRGPKMALFSGEGGSKYYDFKEACKRIHKRDFVAWTCNMITKNKDFLYVDNGNAEEFEQNYFMAIRSNYLPCRQRDYFIIEPYSPHWFSRQFGFFQMMPGFLIRDIRQGSLEDGLYYWRLCILPKTMSNACLPCMPPNAKKFSSEDYKEWWIKVHGGYFEENIMSLIYSKPSNIFSKAKKYVQGDKPLEDSKKKNALEDSGSSNADRHWKRHKKNFDPSKPIGDDASSNPQQMEDFVHELEGELLNIDDDEGPRGSQGSIVGPKSLIEVPPLIKTPQKEISTKEPPHLAAISIFEGESFVLNHQKMYLQKLWSDLREKISKTPIDSISSIKDSVFYVLESMKGFSNFDFSDMEELLQVLFAKAASYDEARSTSSEKASKELLAQQLNEAKDRLDAAKTRESKEVNQVQSTKAELGRMKKELDALKEQKKNLSASLKQQQKLLHTAQAEVREIEEEILAINNTPPLNDDMIGDLETSRLHLETAKEELENLSPFA